MSVASKKRRSQNRRTNGISISQNKPKSNSKPKFRTPKVSKRFKLSLTQLMVISKLRKEGKKNFREARRERKAQGDNQ